MNQVPEKSLEFNRVAECLYRNGNRLHCALVEVNRKQIGRSLKATDLTIAELRLVEFRANANRLEGEELEGHLQTRVRNPRRRTRRPRHPLPGHSRLFRLRRSLLQPRVGC